MVDFPDFVNQGRKDAPAAKAARGPGRRARLV
jgi:hypothetical protein